MQCILSALVAIIIALAPVFNIPLTVVPPKGELPHESEPAPSELSVYDKVVGVDDSVFYIPPERGKYENNICFRFRHGQQLAGQHGRFLPRD